MSYTKYRPHDRHPSAEIMAEFEALLADVARQREAERQAAEFAQPEGTQP